MRLLDRNYFTAEYSIHIPKSLVNGHIRLAYTRMVRRTFDTLEAAEHHLTTTDFDRTQRYDIWQVTETSIISRLNEKVWPLEGICGAPTMDDVMRCAELLDHLGEAHKRST